MTDRDPHRLDDLLDRIARLALADGWTGDLNPAQRSALAYLARANRFSRQPSHVADYLCTTRGTASQTLKALERKGLVRPDRSQDDRRAVSYGVTPAGAAAVAAAATDALSGLAGPAKDRAEQALEEVLHALVRRAGLGTFGLCRTCRHHRVDGKGARCALLDIDLAPAETGQLCHEHVPAA